ncbi:MAG: PucR family transcriptional regulator [Actinomycetota bacterium]
MHCSSAGPRAGFRQSSRTWEPTSSCCLSRIRTPFGPSPTASWRRSTCTTVPTEPSCFRSLRAFLERNARWESAAKDLYVHRHTLRYRIRKIEELTGRSLGSARDRMEFFLALRARDLLAPNGGSQRGRPAQADRKGTRGR